MKRETRSCGRGQRRETAARMRLTHLPVDGDALRKATFGEVQSVFCMSRDRSRDGRSPISAVTSEEQTNGIPIEHVEVGNAVTAEERASHPAVESAQYNQ